MKSALASAYRAPIDLDSAPSTRSRTGNMYLILAFGRPMRYASHTRSSQWPEGRKTDVEQGFLRDYVVLKVVARGRIELPTYGFSDRRSPN